MRTGVGSSLACAGDNIVNASSAMQIRSTPFSLQPDLDRSLER